MNNLHSYLTLDLSCLGSDLHCVWYIHLTCIYILTIRKNKKKKQFCIWVFFCVKMKLEVVLVNCHIVNYTYLNGLLKNALLCVNWPDRLLNKSTTFSVQSYICYLFNKSAIKKNVNTLIIKITHMKSVIFKHQVFPWIPSKWQHLL